MRFAVMLAAMAALWVQPAQAAVLVPNTAINALVVGFGTRVDFQLLDPLPPSAQVNLPKFNQFEFHTEIWDGTKRQTVAVDYSNFTFITKILSQTATSFSVEFGFPGDFLNCDASSPIGEICGSYHFAFSNGSWLAVTTPDGNAGAPLNYQLSVISGPDYYPAPEQPSPVPEPASWVLMIAGIGLAGAGLRRRHPHAVATVGLV